MSMEQQMQQLLESSMIEEAKAYRTFDELTEVEQDLIRANVKTYNKHADCKTASNVDVLENGKWVPVIAWTWCLYSNKTYRVRNHNF